MARGQPGGIEILWEYSRGLSVCHLVCWRFCCFILSNFYKIVVSVMIFSYLFYTETPWKVKKRLAQGRLSLSELSKLFNNVYAVFVSLVLHELFWRLAADMHNLINLTVVLNFEHLILTSGGCPSSATPDKFGTTGVASLNIALNVSTVVWRWKCGMGAEIQLPLKRSSRFQRLFPNPSWLVWGRASRHQKLAPTFQG